HTAQRIKEPMPDASRKLDINKEVKSPEWPYEHPRRGDMPPGHHALSFNEYTIRQPPYAADSKYTKVYSYVQGWSGPDYSKNIVVDEKEHPYTGTNYAWVRARRCPRRSFLATSTLQAREPPRSHPSSMLGSPKRSK